MNDSLYYPRTLIISASALSTESNNGKMMGSFFKHYPVKSLAQIYTYPEYPNSLLCDKYYRITDSEMIKSWFGQKVGMTVFRSQQENSTQKSNISSKKYINWPIMRLARDIVWSKKSWNTEELTKWVEDFKPEVIFFQGLNNPTLYTMAEYIANKYNTVVIAHITDDYFLPRLSFSLAFHFRRQRLEHLMYKMLHREKSGLLTVNKYMNDTYQKFFDKTGYVIYNAVSISSPNNKPDHNKYIVVSYIGNLLNNRKSTLKKLCKFISSYSKKDLYRFRIFTGDSLSEHELQLLTCPPYIEYCGSLNADGVKKEMSNSDVLLHFESFHYKNRKDTFLSLSTKLIEYMMASKPILMIGPKEIGSSKFMKENGNITVDVLDKQHVYSALECLLDGEKMNAISQSNYNNVKSLLERSDSDNLVRNLSIKLISDNNPNIGIK